MFAANINSCTGVCILHIYIHTHIYIYIYNIIHVCVYSELTLFLALWLELMGLWITLSITFYKCMHTSIYFICMLFLWNKNILLVQTWVINQKVPWKISQNICLGHVPIMLRNSQFDLKSLLCILISRDKQSNPNKKMHLWNHTLTSELWT